MTILAKSKTILLRDRLELDADAFVYWQTHGEWRLYDAPFEGVYSTLTKEQEEKIRNGFLESCSGTLPVPRRTAIVAAPDNTPLGWVNRYGEDRLPETWNIGISLGEDSILNKGMGTEALTLWTDYLFTNSSVHRIGLDTWSLNPRMIHVAEKLGFTFESKQREMVFWEEQWLDLLHFGMLRPEWEKLKNHDA